jgi:hypothetical protein
MELIARLHTPDEDHGQAIIAHGQPLTVDAIGGAEHLLFEVSCEPGDEGLTVGAPAGRAPIRTATSASPPSWRVRSPC